MAPFNTSICCRSLKVKGRANCARARVIGGLERCYHRGWEELQDWFRGAGMFARPGWRIHGHVGCLRLSVVTLRNG